MDIRIRPAGPSDLDAITALLIEDAKERETENPTLWKLEEGAPQKVKKTIMAAMEAENPAIRQQWLVAESADGIVGLAHSILLPVPPIYAGDFGPPGLIMEDCFVAATAPEDTTSALLAAAEADLIEAGAQVLLVSSVPGGAWETECLTAEYDPLTLYLGKAGLCQSPPSATVRLAREDDVPAIVMASAENRQVLFELSDFWKPHADADVRFGAWMARSLTLTDRDMFVAEDNGTFKGYAISQPVTPLHLPTPHNIAGTGIIDDYFHVDISDPATLVGAGKSGTALLQTAETAREARGDDYVLVVCPAAWASKIEMLQAAGYATAITWFIKRVH